MDNGISPKQAQVANDMIFGSGAMTTGEILEQHGVSAEEYSVWLRDGSYGKYLCSLSESAALSDRPRLIRKLAELSAGGDTKAIKMLLDIIAETGDSQMKAVTPREDVEEIKREIWGNDSV